eukprot:scaffold58793_cov35-Attheya_sp.AAC.1
MTSSTRLFSKGPIFVGSSQLSKYRLHDVAYVLHTVEEYGKIFLGKGSSCGARDQGIMSSARF